MTKKKDGLSHTSLELTFENLRPIENTGFTRGECLVAYGGKNRNQTNIPKEAFEKAEGSVFGVPVVGNWIEDPTEETGGRFGGHDVVLEQKGNDIRIKDSTIPFGFVPQDANPRWTEVEDSDGNSKSYYTVDVILWSERYPSQVKAIENGQAAQSMEIMVNEGDWDEDWDYFDINDFYYSALCLLGKSDDSNKNVEPCFEESEVRVQNFTSDMAFTSKMDELKSAFEGGEKEMKKDKQAEFTDEVEVEEVTEPVENEEEVIETIEDSEVDEAEEVEVEVEEADVEETEDHSYKEEFVALTDKYNSLAENYTKLEEEVVELREYKQSIETQVEIDKKEELVDSYSLLLTRDEIDECVTEEMSVTETEIVLSKAYATKSLEEMKKTKKKESAKLPNRETSNSDSAKKNKFAL